MIRYVIMLACLMFQIPNEEQFIVKVYNVQDLIIEIQQFDHAPILDLQAALNNQNNLLKESTPVTKNVKSYQPIIDIIEKNIEPEIWENGAKITPWKGNLIIYAPKRIHDQLK